MSSGVPKVGILQNAAWNLSDTCRFKLLPPPQPERSAADKEKRDLQVSVIIYIRLDYKLLEVIFRL